jgi:hypothetical protein
LIRGANVPAVFVFFFFFSFETGMLVTVDPSTDAIRGNGQDCGWGPFLRRLGHPDVTVFNQLRLT